MLILQHNLLLSDDRLREILHEPYHTDRICARPESDKQTAAEITDQPMTSRPQKSRVFKGSLFISITIGPICPRLARRQLCVCVCV